MTRTTTSVRPDIQTDKNPSPPLGGGVLSGVETDRDCPGLASLRAEVARLQAEAVQNRTFRRWAEPLLAGLEPQPPKLSPERAALLVGLARRLKRPGETFLARTVLIAASGEPTLAALVDAIAAPGKGQARRLGKAFRAMAGVPAAGLVMRDTDVVEHGRRVWTIDLAPGGVEWPDPIHPTLCSAGATTRHSARR